MANITFTSPLQSTTVTSTVGPRVAPTIGASSDHKGTDFRAASGTDVYAAAPGTIVGINPGSTGYGNYAIIEHPDGSTTLYAHLSSFNGAQEGQQVGTDTPLFSSGSSGVGTGAHLHYERYRTSDQELLSPFGDNDKLNSAAASKGSKMTKSGETQTADKATDDGKKGDQDGNTDTKDGNTKRAETKKPVDQKDHKDISGTTGNYKRTSTKSIATRLPTHEPWPGHPKSTEGPRQALRGDGGKNDGSTGSSSGGGASGSSNGTGTSTNPSGGSAGSGSGRSNGGSGGSTDSSNGYSNYTGTAPTDDKQQAGGEQIYNRLREKGWSDAAATASVGNFMGEGLNSTGKYGEGIHNDPDRYGNPGLSRGVGQWRKERGIALEKFANEGGYPGGWKNLDAQADFYDKELRTDPRYRGNYENLKSSNDQGYVTDYLVNKYERPREELRPTAIRQRMAYGNNFKKKKNAKKPKTGDPGMNKKDGEASPAPSTGSDTSNPSPSTGVSTSPTAAIGNFGLSGPRSS